MKKYLLGLLALSATVIMASCGKDDDKGGSTLPPGDTTHVTLKGDITANQTLSAKKKYLLQGFVYVKSGVTLTIEPGTIIMGDKATKGTLVVSRGGKIDAQGTAQNPIIFTSAQPIGARREGDWGGIILLGKAKINPTAGEAKIEGGLVPTTGGDEKAYIWYGGTDDADNSGIIKYVRIEFAGVPYSPDNEINGLTMGGVGNKTTISYVQVYRSGDDAYEWFGGSVNCDHLIATASWDDDFDTDNGFSGKIQFGLAQRYKTVADQSGSNGFESDNDANGSVNAPQTAAVFTNMTIIGPIMAGNVASGINANFQHGAQIRRNSSMSLYNSIIVGFPIGFYLDDSKVASHKTSDNANENTLVFKNNIIAGCAQLTKAEWTGFDAWWATTGTDVITKAEDVLLNNAYQFSPLLTSTAANIGTPNFLLKTGSPALIGADFSSITGLGFTTVTYRGAFDGTTDWTQGWTEYAPENKDYGK